ncbi:MAG TPA: formyl transferase [Longimicrobium sp.]|jgi:folate-dependent phosphoribosylglycinamide formyltransferase PurN
MSGASRRVVLLCGPGPSTNIVYHALAREFGDVTVVMETLPTRSHLLRRRLRKLGIATVAGQLPFQLAVVPLLRRASARRIEAIMREHGLDDSPIPEPVIIRIPSTNSDEAREELRRLDPAVIVVNGTRIISRATLASTAAPFVNMHAGITPAYRGVHGGYWALVEGRPDLAGTTVHFVDEGIDTGGIIAQATFTVTPEDSFATYPHLHLAVGVPILVRSVRGLLEGTLQRDPPREGLESRLRSHPTVWGYAGARFRRGVR